MHRDCNTCYVSKMGGSLKCGDGNNALNTTLAFETRLGLYFKKIG